MSLAPERLHALRRLYLERGDAPAGRDIAYLSYAGMLVLAIVAFPLARMVVLFLVQPANLAALQLPDVGAIVGVICGLLIAVLVVVGQARGPVTPSPFFVMLLAATDLRRSVALRRSFLISALAVTAVTTAVGALFAGVLIAGGASSALSGGMFVASCACFGLVGSVVWLAGQRVTSRWRWIAGIALAAGAAVGWMYPLSAAALPWGWVGLLWPATHTPLAWPLIGLVLLTLAALALVPRLVNALDGSRLLDAAERWQAASTAAVAGDVAHALGTFRARPTVGRAWRAVTARSTVTRFLQSDLVATLRAPGRFTVAALCLIGGWVILELSLTASSALMWLPAAVGSTVAYLALGAFSDGFRHVAEAVAAPPLYGYGVIRLYFLHAFFPTVITAVTGIAGFVIALRAGAQLSALAVVGLLLLVFVLVRAYDSAKGDLPLVLLTPVPTPGGDLSVLLVLAWQADALLLAVIGGAVTVTLLGSGQIVAAFGCVALVIVVLAFGLRRRLRLHTRRFR